MWLAPPQTGLRPIYPTIMDTRCEAVDPKIGGNFVICPAAIRTASPKDDNVELLAPATAVNNRQLGWKEVFVG
jgi:hypothetical protein